MVALALDIGETRIGIAVSDRSGRVASPVKVLPAAEVIGLAKSFLYIMEDYEPDVLVSGRPMTMAGDRRPSVSRRRLKKSPMPSISPYSLKTSA